MTFARSKNLSCPAPTFGSLTTMNDSDVAASRWRLDSILWALLRFFVAGVLLFSSWEKARFLASGFPVTSNWLVDHPTVQFLAVIAESAFAVWLLGGLAPKLTCAAVSLLFLLFAGVSLLKGLSGETSCGCFGSKEVNPYVTFLLDAAIVFCSLALLSRLWKSRRSDFVPKVGARLWATLAACLVVSGVFASSVFLFETERETILLERGDVSLAPGSVVILEPELWLDQECPLFKFCSGSESLKSGVWIVMLRRVGCKTCHELLPQTREAAMAQNASLALVDVEFSDEKEDAAPADFVGRLDSNYLWMVETPSVFRLVDGKVDELLTF